MKKFYIKPVTESFPMILEDIIIKSPNAEELKQHTDGNQDDWGDSIIIDPGEDINW